MITYLEAETENVLGTAIKFGVRNNRRTFVPLGQSKFELSSAHEKIDVWNGP